MFCLRLGVAYKKKLTPAIFRAILTTICFSIYTALIDASPVVVVTAKTPRDACVKDFYRQQRTY